MWTNQAHFILFYIPTISVVCLQLVKYWTFTAAADFIWGEKKETSHRKSLFYNELTSEYIVIQDGCFQKLDVLYLQYIK